MENGRLMAVVGFVVGVFVGLNWQRIKRSLPKAQETMSDLLALTQEKMGEMTVAAQRMLPKTAPRRKTRRVAA